jgi:predicted Fe-Mo cluster-binding NifX family protein
MRIAIPEWQGRVSPVFDVAVNMLLIDVDSGHERRREQRQLHGADDSPARIAEFLSFGVETLICGAISTPVEARLVASGVQVVGFTCGRVDHVLAAYLRGELANQLFAMPGCKRRWREGGDVMPRGFGMGAGRGGGGRGQGRCQGPVTGSKGGTFTTGPGGFCVCPKCGEKAPHTPGRPCLQMLCPKCGGNMTRL